MDMSKEIGYTLIIGVCVLVLIMGLLRKKTEILVNFILRVIFGVIGIYLVNMFFTWQKLDYLVGMNPVSAATIGVLGIPGFLLLYGIVITSSL